MYVVAWTVAGAENTDVTNRYILQTSLSKKANENGDKMINEAIKEIGTKSEIT